VLIMKTSLFDRATPALVAFALAGAVGLAVPAAAQNAPMPAGAPGQQYTGGAGTPGRGAAAGAPTSPTAWVQQQIERLHTQLKITPGQEQTWNQFAEIMRANAEHMDRLYQDRAEHFQNMSAVENLKNYQQIVQAQAEDTGKKVAAFESLYDSMSPEQKQTADRIFRYQEERREQRHMAHSPTPR
jgi:periplasmic protein CpxP/Spy